MDKIANLTQIVRNQVNPNQIKRNQAETTKR